MLKKVLVVFYLVCFSLPAAAQTIDEIIKKNIQTRGGYKKIKSVKSAKITGKMVAGPMEMPMTLYWKRPGKMRMEMTVQGQQIVQAFDGKTGWMIMPMMGSKEPQKMPKEQLDAMKSQANEMFEGPLVDYKKKGHKIDLLGKEDMQGTETFKLRVKLKDGKERIYYLDSETGIELKTTEKISRKGIKVIQHSLMGDYKKVEGIMMPHTIDTKDDKGQGGQLTFKKVELGIEIKDNLFSMPPKAG